MKRDDERTELRGACELHPLWKFFCVTSCSSLVLLAWMYLTPIIYPESIVPARHLSVIQWNPFTPLVRCYRRVLIDGLPPDWPGLAYFTVFALISFAFGYWWFAKTRKNFADVI